MKRNKLVVLSVDALLWEDLYIARNYPGFSRIMKQHCGVEQVLSVYPTQTYPIHVVQATGQNMMDIPVQKRSDFVGALRHFSKIFSTAPSHFGCFLGCCPR